MSQESSKKAKSSIEKTALLRIKQYYRDPKSDVYKQKAIVEAKHSIEANAFKDIDGYYLDSNSDVCKRIFKDWPKYPDDNWPKTTAYLGTYDKHLRSAIVRSKNTNYKDLTR